MTIHRPNYEAPPPPEDLQPDPMLREGRAHPVRIAAILGACVLAVALLFYGLTRESQDSASVTPPAETPAPAVATSPNPGQPGAPQERPETTGQAPAANQPAPEQPAQPNNQEPAKQ